MRRLLTVILCVMLCLAGCARKDNVSSTENVAASTGIPEPDQLSEQGEYFWENATVYAAIDAAESEDVIVANEAEALMEERNIDAFPLTYEYSLDGEYQGEKTAADNPDEKSPIYQTFYISSSNEVWTIFIINGQVFANPVSFNIQSTLPAPLLISESEQLTSYDKGDNLFLVLDPNESTAIVKTVDVINAETLDKLTIEEINKL